MKTRVLTADELVDFKGVYEDFLVTSNKLIAFISVEALNLDLEDDFSIKNILSNYSAFLLSVKNRRESIMNVTMTAKNDTEQYQLYWKYKLLQVDTREDLDEVSKSNLKQLIASKILNIEEHTRNNEAVIKQHFMVVGEDLKSKSYEDYENAKDKLQKKCTTIVSEMHEWLRNCNRDLEVEVVGIQESLKILQHFIDNKSAMLS